MWNFMNSIVFVFALLSPQKLKSESIFKHQNTSQITAPMMAKKNLLVYLKAQTDKCSAYSK
jgi:hypothetical protein